MSHTKTTYLNAVFNVDGKSVISDLRSWAEKNLSGADRQEYENDMDYLGNALSNSVQQNKTFMPEEITEIITTQYGSRIKLSVGNSYTYDTPEFVDPLIRYDHWFGKMGEAANIVKSFPIKVEVL